MKLTPHGAVYQPRIHTPGSSYTNGDIVDVPGGTNGTLVVSASPAGLPVNVQVVTAGQDYTTASNVPVSGGTGTGLTVDLSAVLVPGMSLPAGGGSIQQGGRLGPIVRQRNPSNSAARNARHQRWANCRRYLAICAKYWADTLTGAQRTAWDTIGASVGKTGFETFISINKKSQGDAFTQPDISAWNQIPPFINAPQLFAPGGIAFGNPAYNPATPNVLPAFMEWFPFQNPNRFQIELSYWPRSMRRRRHLPLSLWDSKPGPVPYQVLVPFDAYDHILPTLGPIERNHVYLVSVHVWRADKSLFFWNSGQEMRWLT